jgi:hypothetical protein
VGSYYLQVLLGEAALAAAGHGEPPGARAEVRT